MWFIVTTQKTSPCTSQTVTRPRWIILILFERAKCPFIAPNGMTRFARRERA